MKVIFFIILVVFHFAVLIDGFDFSSKLRATVGLKEITRVTSTSVYMKVNDGFRKDNMKALAKTLSIIPVTLFYGASMSMANSPDTTMAVSIVRPSLDLFVNVLSFLFIVRTVLSWYPKTDLKKFPYNAIIWPTEPLLEPVRGLIPPAFGVDVSSIFWIMLLSFFREIFTGQQGILTLIERS